MNHLDFLNKYNHEAAIISEKYGVVSYDSLRKYTDELGKQLDSKCLVFCFCENNLETVVGYLAFLKKSIAPVMLSLSMSQEQKQRLYTIYQPELIWTKIELTAEFPENSVVFTWGEYILLRSKWKSSEKMYDNLALLLTTSGSTGSPKLVRLSYRNLLSNSEAISNYLSIRSTDKTITTMPMNYSYGLSIINSHLFMGASIYMTEKTMMEKEFWQTLKKEKITSISGVPYHYKMLDKVRFFRMDLPDLQTMTQAGGKLGKELSLKFAQNCQTKGIRFFVMYGQTEASPRMSYLPGEYSVSKAGSIGVPIPGGKFWLEDDETKIIIKNNTPGNLVYQGPNVSLGYGMNITDLRKGDDNDGILKTGDIAYRDEDGFYFIVGRKTRFLKLFGNRVNLDEVEMFLNSKGFDCACTGYDDQLRIHVTNVEQNNNLEQYILEHTGINPAGFKVSHTDNIPRNDSGKILYSELTDSDNLNV
jgi:long-chain acyl-CoA synthetase